MATRYRCPDCGQAVTVYVPVTDPPWCWHRGTPTVRTPKQMEEQK